MLLEIHPQNPQPRLIQQVVECLRNDGIIIYPTDTVYAIGCNIHSKKAIERICKLRGINPEKANLSCVCEDLKIIGDYALHVDTNVFKLMKMAFPGPYTFILQASKNIPRHFQSRRKTVGIRVIDHAVPTEIVRLLGNPILTASLKGEDDFEEYPTEPWEMHDRFSHLVDYVIDCGTGGTEGSTIIDASEGAGNITVVREGAGDIRRLGIELQE